MIVIKKSVHDWLTVNTTKYDNHRASNTHPKYNYGTRCDRLIGQKILSTNWT